MTEFPSRARTSSLHSKGPVIVDLLQQTRSLSLISQSTQLQPYSVFSSAFANILAPICEILHDQRDFATLLAIQRVNQAGWEAATPYIYRNMIITGVRAWDSLLCPFNTLNNLSIGLHLLHKGNRATPTALLVDPLRLERIRLAWRYPRSLVIFQHPPLCHRALLAIAQPLLGTTTCFDNCFWISMPAVAEIHHKSLLLEDQNTVYAKVLGGSAYRRICLSKLARPGNLCIHAAARHEDFGAFSLSWHKKRGRRLPAMEYTPGILRSIFASRLRHWSFHTPIDMPGMLSLAFKQGVINRTILRGVARMEQLEGTCLNIASSIYASLKLTAEKEEKGETVKETEWRVYCEEGLIQDVGDRIITLLLSQERVDINVRGYSPVSKGMSTEDGFSCLKGFNVEALEDEFICYYL